MPGPRCPVQDKYIFPLKLFFPLIFHLDSAESEDLRGARLLHGVQSVGVHPARGLVGRRSADYIFHLNISVFL